MKTVILLTAYNGAEHLPDLLDSLLGQTDPDFSVLMQDDGSSDTTPTLLRRISGRDPRFTFGREQGRHLGAAGNFCSLIRQCEGAGRVMLCDQDDVWEPEKVARLKAAMDALETEYGAGVPLLVHSDCSLVGSDGAPIGPSFFRHQGWDPGAVTLPPLLVQNNVTGCTLIMNEPLRALIAAHAKAKDLFMHDWFIALTAASFGHIAFVDEPLTRYRQHGDNAIGASSRSLVRRGLAAFKNRRESKRRIKLTYTHTKVFRKLYEGELPPEALSTVSAYLATERMPKLRRVLAVRRLGCRMQSTVTRLGQVLFG